MIPTFDWREVMVLPWTENFSFTFWIVMMGFLVAGACGLVGNYLLLRRMALVGDAISHSILPGLVGAFVVFQSTAVWVSFLGAVVAGVVTVALIEMIHRQSRIKPDAAICIAFTSLFALGVIWISALESKGGIHIDAECVLYGEISFVPLEPMILLGGVPMGPPSVLRMGTVFLLIVAAIVVFRKELLITSFDPGMARSLGMRTAVWHYGLMVALSLAVVAAFQAVGAILAVAMLVVPPMFAAQLSERLGRRFLLTLLHAGVSAVAGVHLSIWLGCSTAGAMVVVGAVLFALAWMVTAVGAILRRRAMAQR